MFEGHGVPMQTNAAISCFVKLSNSKRAVTYSAWKKKNRTAEESPGLRLAKHSSIAVVLKWLAYPLRCGARAIRALLT
jgi:hypothetical protein